MGRVSGHCACIAGFVLINVHVTLTGPAGTARAVCSTRRHDMNVYVRNAHVYRSFTFTTWMFLDRRFTSVIIQISPQKGNPFLKKGHAGQVRRDMWIFGRGIAANSAGHHGQ